MNTEELQRQVQELRQLRRRMEELAAEIEEVQDIIKAEMTAQDTDTLAGDDYRVTWKPVTSAKLDAKALKAARPDIYDAFTRLSTVRRFVLA